MSEPTIQLAYVSAATRPIDEAELAELLRVARCNNEKLGISGLLLYQDQSFIQVLEGPEAAVDATFSKIEADDRHEESRVIYRGTTDEAIFEGWSMGYMSTTKVDDLPEGFHPFLRSGFRRKLDDEEYVVRNALLAFRDGRWRQGVSS